MRPVLVVVVNKRLNDVIDMPQAEAGEVAQALAFQRRDPGLGKRVSIRCHHRRFDNLNPC